MNLGFWNVRGMNREKKQLDVHNFLQSNNAGLFGLIETKIKPGRLNNVMNNVFKEWSISTNSAYHSGGRIWIVWKPNNFDVQFLEYNAQYIHMHITEKGSRLQFYHTIVYAFNGISERESLWSDLKRIARYSHGPWAVGGDFNYVLSANERLGGKVSTSESEPFQDCLDSCSLMDNQALGAYYTWNNKQPPETRVYSRLDSFVVNQDWMQAFPNMVANFLPEGHFDHTPCLVSMNNKSTTKSRPFKYFNMWSLAPGFKECVLNGWNQRIEGTKMFRIVKKLKALKLNLKTLNNTQFSRY
ncbi:uncharacterized protein LOC141590221 [Silene latifolia]|uniref:uncharacterized protein LOC141590221 n=1 Tax=Silene latifolia TaxID=37657 RepID=UPI003D770C4F